MATIKNREALQAEIARLQSELQVKEQRIKTLATDLRQSLKPANLFSSFFKSFIGDPEASDKNFITKVIKKALLSLTGKIFSKSNNNKDEHTPGILDTMFEKIKKIIARKLAKKKESKYYRFDDAYDSESN